MEKTKHAHQDNKQRRRKTTQKKNKANDEDTVWEDIELTENNPKTENGNVDLKTANMSWIQNRYHAITATKNILTTT